MGVIVGIKRARIFSPNSVDRDSAIFHAVLVRLETLGYIVEEYEEDECLPITDCYFSMGRYGETLKFLKEREDEGAVVINSAFGVEACTRSALIDTMIANNIPMPGEEGQNGYWLKRGDAAAQSSADVIYAADEKALESAKQQFRNRGIRDMVISAHVKGDIVKFYGVNGTGFFRYFYPTDDGIFKFNDEEKNGRTHHYSFDNIALQKVAEHLSKLVKTPVYGGDCIISCDGAFKIIDFNDWPSFSRCRDEAANAIVSLIKSKYGHKF